MGDSVPSRTVEEEEEFDEVNGNRFHHVRTASVILPSGDRVRRKVSLMSVFDGSPIDEDEQSPLFGQPTLQWHLVLLRGVCSMSRDLVEWINSKNGFSAKIQKGTIALKTNSS